MKFARTRRTTAPLHLLFCGAILSALLACGDDPEPTAAPASGEKPAASAPASSVQEVSREAKQCLDLVKAKSYVEAIDPCERALADGADLSVQSAYDEAQAAVEEAAKAAALQAASDSMAGKPADEAAKDAAGDALRGLSSD